MPIYRIGNAGGNNKLSRIYRIANNGVAKNLSRIYRIANNGALKVVHMSGGGPTEITAATLKNQDNSTTDFYGGDTLTLTRGSYTLTNNATQYRLTIYRGLNQNSPINDSNWSPESRATYTGLNSTVSTSITHSVTDTDAFLGYYFVGEIRVTIGTTNYFFYTPIKVLSRISLSATGLSTTTTDNDATFSWSVGGIGGDSSYISNQVLTTRLSNAFGTVVDTASVPNGKLTTSDRSYIILNSLTPATNYYSEIVVTANDYWKNTANPTTSSSNHFFTTKNALPQNIIAPTIGPLNNAGGLPVSTTLTADKGTWNNVNAFTTYTYDWFMEDWQSGLLSSYLNSGTTRTFSTGDVANFVYVRVKATNSDGGNTSALSQTYSLYQQVAVGTISPTTAIVNTPTSYTFTISHYPTQYRISWGDSSSDETYTVSANTSTVNASHSHTYTTSGTYTIIVFADPGNVISSATVTVNLAQPAAFTYTISNSGSVTTPSTPTQQRVSSTSNTVLIDIASSKPSDTSEYEINIYGSGSAAGGTALNPAKQYVSTLNLYDSNGNFGSGTWDTITNISSSATSSSPISIFTIATGTTRSIFANVSTTTGAAAWAINWQWSGSSSNAVTAYSTNLGTGITNSSSQSGTSGTLTVYANYMPFKLADITGPANPNIFLNSMTAYSSTDLSSSSRVGNAGSPTTIASAALPQSASGTSTANYTYYQVVAPSGGTVNAPSLSSGTANRVGAVYAVSINTEASGTSPITKSYKWQVFITSWTDIPGATSSSYTIPWTVNIGGSDIHIPSRSIRYQVTWTNSAGSQTATSSSVTIAAPTITGITVSFFEFGPPWATYFHYGYNFRSTVTTVDYSNTAQSTAPSSSSQYSSIQITSGSGNTTIPITRNINAGGLLFWYRITSLAYTGIGSGSGTPPGFNSTTAGPTAWLRNNATNRSASPINTFGSGSA